MDEPIDPRATIASRIQNPPAIPESGIILADTLSDIERAYIQEALMMTDNNLTRAAELLGMSFRSMRYKVKKLGLRGKDKK